MGAVGVFLGATTYEAERLWQGLLFNWLFWSSVAIGMVMFAVALHLTAADWAWSIQRFALGGVAFLPISFVLLAVVFLGNETYFHHWLHAEGSIRSSRAKRAWLTLRNMIGRDFVGLIVLYGLAIALHVSEPPAGRLRGDRRAEGSIYQSMTGDGGVSRSRRPRSVSRAELPRSGHGRPVRRHLGNDRSRSRDDARSTFHQHDVPGRLLLGGVPRRNGGDGDRGHVASAKNEAGDFFPDKAVSRSRASSSSPSPIFWMYLNWSQYIVIWYGLLPWEQPYFAERFADPYGPISATVVSLCFVLPFFGLLTRPPKKVPAVVAFFGALILLGHWLERFLIAIPSIWESPELPLGLPEVAIGLGFVGLFLTAYLWFVRTFPMLPSPASLAAMPAAIVHVPAPTARAM